MDILKIPRKVILRIRRYFFQRRFSFFHPSSAIGDKGYGKNCKIIGFKNISIGRDVYFGDGTELLAYDHNDGTHAFLSIGNHVRCAGGRLRITCAGKITIGEDVLIAPDVFITDHNHGIKPNPAGGGYSKQPLQILDVSIEQGVWLGQRVCVLPGVTIGKHSIIGAQSVVTHSIPPYSIAVGVPAKIVKVYNHSTEAWEKFQRTEA